MDSFCRESRMIARPTLVVLVIFVVGCQAEKVYPPTSNPVDSVYQLIISDLTQREPPDARFVGAEVWVSPQFNEGDSLFYSWGDDIDVDENLVATIAWYWVASTLVPPTKNEGLDQITSMRPVVVLGIVITAAIGEEVFFRGYLIERLREGTGYLWVGALVSFAIFLIPHIQYFGMSWLNYHSMGAVMIYALYLSTRNLIAVMLLHLLVNLPIMIPTLASYYS